MFISPIIMEDFLSRKKTACFQAQLASTETAVFLECIQVILHLLCGLWQQTAGR